MKKLLLGTVATLMAGSAYAADLPARMPVKAPIIAPVVYSWTGCYIGGNVGGLWARKRWTASALTVEESQDVDGWLGGGQVGCNYQTGPWVFGIQGDYDWADARRSTSDPVFFPRFSENTRIKSLGSVTGRVGYAWDRFLGYVKGGVAWERDNYDIDFITGGVFASASETRTGWTVGVGGEYMFTEWLTGFAEYDYYDFGTRTETFATTFATNQFAFDIRETKHVAKVGLNFKWGWAPPPLVTKY
jgi:outer membrane immunogenic protein